MIKRLLESWRGRSRRSPSQTSPTADAYYRNRVLSRPTEDSSTRIGWHKQLLKRRKLLKRLGVLALILTGIALLLVQYTTTATFYATGSSVTKPIDQAAYRLLLDDYFREHPLERFRSMIRHDALLAHVTDKRPEVAVITPAGIDRIGVARFDVSLRMPVAKWDTNGRIEYVDSLGVTFQRNFYDEPSVVVRDDSGSTVSSGEAITSQRMLRFTGQVVAALRLKNLDTASVELPSNSLRTVHIKARKAPEIRMTIDGEVATQVEDAAKAIEYLRQNNRRVKYIDVRVPGRVFYK